MIHLSSSIVSLKSEKDIKTLNDLLIEQHRCRIERMLKDLKEALASGRLCGDEQINSASLLIEIIEDIPELELIEGRAKDEQETFQAQNFVVICLVDEYEEHVNKLLRYGVAYNPEEE